MSIAKEILNELEAELKELNEHAIYKSLNNISALKCFMSYHLYAVWDFMNLLTYLQQSLTCISLPWKPTVSAKTTRLINEIKLEEESDLINGVHTSHFMYYLSTFKKIGDLPKDVKNFIADLEKPNIKYSTLIKQKYINPSIQNFLKHSYDAIENSILATAATFTYARETLMSDMLNQILKQQSKQMQQIKDFNSYLTRHIALDGDKHSFLALDLIDELCKNSKDKIKVLEYAKKGIQYRILLWDDILKKIHEN
eukprot:COSAG01_NODE_52_length_31456_cov_125.226648_22_plen_254_part_00